MSRPLRHILMCVEELNRFGGVPSHHWFVLEKVPQELTLFGVL